MKKTLLLAAICLSVGSSYAQEAVTDVGAYAYFAAQLSKLEKEVSTAMETLDKTTGILSAAEDIKEKSDKVREQTKNIQEWIGDAKKAVIGNVEEIMNIEEIQEVVTTGKSAVQFGKEMYGVYDTGKKMYDKGKDIYEAATNAQEQIETMFQSMENLQEKREEALNAIKSLASEINSAEDLNEIKKKEAGISAAKAKVEVLSAQEGQITNSLLMQRMQMEQSRQVMRQNAYDQEQNKSRAFENANYNAIMQSILKKHANDNNESGMLIQGGEWDF